MTARLFSPRYAWPQPGTSNARTNAERGVFCSRGIVSARGTVSLRRFWAAASEAHGNSAASANRTIRQRRISTIRNRPMGRAADHIELRCGDTDAYACRAMRCVTQLSIQLKPERAVLLQTQVNRGTAQHRHAVVTGVGAGDDARHHARVARNRHLVDEADIEHAVIRARLW